MSIFVTKPYLPDIDKYKAYIDRIYDSNHLTNDGPLKKELEQRLAEYLGVKNIFVVSNGTLALQVAYKALDLKGDVLTTPFSFIATSSSLIWEGFNPIYVDIDQETLNIDPEKINKTITKDTSAIVPVHVFGNSCEVEKIEEIAGNNNLKVIYDAAHAFGCNYKDKGIMNFGDISTLSFHATKIFHTIEGGAIIVNDDEVAQKVKAMISFGISGGEPAQLGINAKVNEFQAAMGLCVLDDIEEILEKRKKICNLYKEGLSDLITLQTRNENSTANYSYFPIIFKDEETLLRINSLLVENSIYGRRYFYPSLDTVNYINKENICMNSLDISKRVFCLPLYPSLEITNVEKIIDIINGGLK